MEGKCTALTAAACFLPKNFLQIDGIWHSSIVVGGEEYYFGFGINVSLPGQSPFGQPTQVIDLGCVHALLDVCLVALQGCQWHAEALHS